jgi:hypothetical protein
VTFSARAIPAESRRINAGRGGGLAHDQVLTTNRMLAVGRALRADVSPQLRAEEELITFWADKQTAAS